MNTATRQPTHKRARAAHASWQQLVLTYVDRDRAELTHVSCPEDPRTARIETMLHGVATLAVQSRSVAEWWTGARQDRAWLSLHEAEADIDELLEGSELEAHARDLLVKAAVLLPAEDPRVRVVSASVPDRGCHPSTPLDPVEVAHLARAVNDSSDQRFAQSRCFRNRLIRLTVLSTLALLSLLAAFATSGIPLDVLDSTAPHVETALLVALFGAVGALITAVRPLSRVTGTWNPYSLPSYQMLLKVALGPTFALLGVMLLQSGVLPDVTLPMPLADLLVWALVFGASQQLVTKLVDDRVAGLVSSDPGERTESSQEATGP